ncbi:VIT family protein [Xanthomonadaceae bacterium JHOS43]|nr:VIT family protein [Xanthomonadaceae bacterium JHOS43]MCX7562999.1 VIT family protein [Xanthomonadaceae bacterium XH05]
MPHANTPPIPSTPHRVHRVGWLRAAVLGANDGIVSTSGLVVGIAASGAEPGTILLGGVAGLVAGAMSMAAGEYVSVKSQADAEEADLAIERQELASEPQSELEELAYIYRQRGLDAALAHQVAVQLTHHNALAAHARDELGITDSLRARPIQAAIVSAACFSLGATLPLLAALLAPASRIHDIVIVATLVGLLLSGALAARAGGAPVIRGALRVVFWGAAAMLATSIVGRLFGG